MTKMDTDETQLSKPEAATHRSSSTARMIEPSHSHLPLFTEQSHEIKAVQGGCVDKTDNEKEHPTKMNTENIEPPEAVRAMSGEHKTSTTSCTKFDAENATTNDVESQTRESVQSAPELPDDVSLNIVADRNIYNMDMPLNKLEVPSDTVRHAGSDSCVPAGVKQSDAGQQAGIRTLALPQNFAELAAVKKEVLIVPVRKPGPQVWFSPHLDASWRMNVAAIEIKEDGEHYIVAPNLQDELIGEWVPKVLVPCQTRQKTSFLWPIRLPDADGKHNSWHASALEIVDTYAGKWIRIKANREAGGYDVITPISEIPPPDWPSNPDTLLERAFKGRIIDSPDHRILKQLRGEA